MITVDGSLIRKDGDSFHPLERGKVDIRYVCDSKGYATISLMYGDLMIFADAKELTKLIMKNGGK